LDKKVLFMMFCYSF